MRKSFLLAVGILVVGIGTGTGIWLWWNGEGQFKRAEEAVSSILFDPYSAQFRDLYRSRHGVGVCGQVNAKNRMGAYIGYTSFYVADATGRVSMVREQREPRSFWTHEDFMENVDIATDNLDVHLNCYRARQGGHVAGVSDGGSHFISQGRVPGR